MSKSDGGKGSTPRPFSVAQAEYEARWDAIFGRDSVYRKDTLERKVFEDRIKPYEDELAKKLIEGDKK
jgi:hypothetical protein